MNYYETHALSRKEKNEIEKLGLYCYDLRSSDSNDILVATIEKKVYINRIGSIITDKSLFNEEKNSSVDYVDYKTFINDAKNVSDLADLIDESKFTDYGEIDLSSKEMIEYEFDYLYSASDEYERINKLRPADKKIKMLEHYRNVNDYAIIEDSKDKYKLYHIEKEKKLEDLVL